MELDELIKGTKNLYNCCDHRATDIIAEVVNDGKQKELEMKIENYYKHVQYTKG